MTGNLSYGRYTALCLFALFITTASAFAGFGPPGVPDACYSTSSSEIEKFSKELNNPEYQITPGSPQSVSAQKVFDLESTIATAEMNTSCTTAGQIKAGEIKNSTRNRSKLVSALCEISAKDLDKDGKELPKVTLTCSCVAKIQSFSPPADMAEACKGGDPSRCFKEIKGRMTAGAKSDITREEALAQFTANYEKVISDAGEEHIIGPEELNDFDNLWRKTAEYSVPGGQGLDNPEGNWAQLLGEHTGYMKERFSPTFSNGGCGGDADKDGDGWAD